MAYGGWKNASNQRNFMDELCKKLNISDPKGLFIITQSVLREHGGASLLERYKYSVSKLLASVYPEYHGTLRESILNIMRDLRISAVQDLMSVPCQYPFSVYYCSVYIYIYSKEPHLVRQHGYSISRCTPS